MSVKLALKLVVATFLTAMCVFPSSALAQSSNRSQVRHQIAEEGGYLVWGITINEPEYAKFIYACYQSVASENPGPVMAYFKDMAERNIDKFADQAPDVGRKGMRDLLVKAFNERGKTFRDANVEVQAGIATYRRWKSIRVPDGTERYKIYGPRNPATGKRTWTYGYRLKYATKRISLPNHHQPYIRFRIFKPAAPPPVVNPVTFWSYGNADGGGYFQKTGNEWVEMKGGSVWARFTEQNSSGGVITLYDAQRNMEVRLERRAAFWRYPGASWSYLFDKVN